MKISLTINRPGYLPDNEDYPYIFEGDDKDCVAVIQHEINEFRDNGYGPLTFTQVKHMYGDVLIEGKSGGFWDHIDGSDYAIDVDVVERD
jgi:hypothetical protein